MGGGKKDCSERQSQAFLRQDVVISLIVAFVVGFQRGNRRLGKGNERKRRLIWFVAICLTLVTAWFILAPLLRDSIGEAENADVAVYKSQLAEVERDVARGILNEDDAERTKTEISRRLLAAARSTTANTHAKAISPILAVFGAGAVLVASLGTYVVIGAPSEPDQPLSLRLEQAEVMRSNRPNQAQMVAAAPPPPPVDAPAEYLESVAQLRVLIPTRPDDLKGWELLAFHEAELLNFDAAAKAQTQVVALKDPVEIADQVRLLDLMVFAANGFVSPEAEVVAQTILEGDQENTAARYYFGALNDQTGRPDQAYRIWRPLVESGADTFHIALARAQIGNAAARAGVDYEPPALAGPDLAMIEAAEEMSPEDRADMVRGMVNQLSDRLATQGGTATEWARLIRAHGVLGEVEQAQAVYQESLSVFGADENALSLLNAAAEAAGIAQ